MAALKGIDFVVQKNTGSEETPNWETIAGQRGATLTINNAEIDATTKDGSGWEEKLVGLKSWSLDFDGLYSEDDDVLQELETDVLAGNKVHVRLKTPGDNTFHGDCIITDFSIEAPHDGEATASGSLAGAEALTEATV